MYNTSFGLSLKSRSINWEFVDLPTSQSLRTSDRRHWCGNLLDRSTISRRWIPENGTKERSVWRWIIWNSMEIPTPGKRTGSEWQCWSMPRFPLQIPTSQCAYERCQLKKGAKKPRQSSPRFWLHPAAIQKKRKVTSKRRRNKGVAPPSVFRALFS